MAFGHFPLTGGTGLPLKGKAFGRPQGPPLRRIQKPSVFNVGAGHWPARRCTRRVQEAAPYTPAPAATCSARPGAVVEAQQRQFLNSQGPVARREFRPATQILRAGYVLPSLSGNSRNGGPGKGDYEHEVLIGAVPGGVLVTLPPRAKSLAARRRRNPPAHNNRNPKLAPSSAPFGGTFPPGGRLLGGKRPLNSRPERSFLGDT